jgi:hypothetical protein
MIHFASGEESPNLVSRIDEIHADYVAKQNPDANQSAAAVYVRGRDSGKLIEDQVHVTLELAAANNFVVSREHIFVDQTNGNGSFRPGLKALKQLLDDGQIKVLVVVSTSRLFRKVCQLNEFMGVYLSRGVRVIHGDSSNAKRSPHDNIEASEIREIFELSAAGKTPAEIAEHFNSLE